MNVVGKLLDELQMKPRRFRDTGGYERLLDALREGQSPDALKQALSAPSDVAGDLLWTVAELETVEPFVSEALQYLSSSDKGTAAYAMEIVLRGGQHSADLRAAFDQLRVCDVVVCRGAVQSLAGAGLTRLMEILEATGREWCCALAETLSDQIYREEIERLILDTSRDRQVVGLALATLAWEQDPTYASSFACSDEAWIRDYGEWLEQ